MIKVFGKIESLKKIRTLLKIRGLTQFNSIGDINKYLLNYESKIRDIRKEAVLHVDKEHELLVEKKSKLKKQEIFLRELIIKDLSSEISKIQSQILNCEMENVDNNTASFFNYLKLKFYRFRKRKLIDKQQIRINEETAHLQLECKDIDSRLTNYKSFRLSLIEIQAATKSNKIEFTKEVLDEISPLIAGAIGESKVEKEIMRLGVNGVLINDFSATFYPPIYNSKAKDRIYSVQIDHILITGAGIFVLETKNWSEKSIESLDLRSPVDQIRRSSFAIFVLVNSTNDESLGMKMHHWGKRQVPIRNVIVMINYKPKAQFKYVKVKTLNELNGYIQFFEPIFTDEEVNSIANFLLDKKQDDPSKI